MLNKNKSRQHLRSDVIVIDFALTLLKKVKTFTIFRQIALDKWYSLRW
jgi:hypothetical protein